MSAICSPPENKNVWAGYRLRHLRGAGAFGRVWEAEAPDGRSVAFKVVSGKSGIAVPEIRNVRNVSQLSHPHIIRIEKIWCEREHLIFVMDLADGSLQDLADVSQIEFGMPLSARALCDYFRQAAEALDFLNARRHLIGGRRVGVQHRDIKPGNLLLFGDQVKLSDFGLATTIAAPVVLQDRAGTLDYAAPEVFRGNLSDWTDQYALAVTYCQLRGGRPPFPDTPANFRRDYTRPVPDLSMLDAAERPIIARALSSAPQDRWPCCKDMARHLLALVPKKGAHDPSERRLVVRRPCPHRPRIHVMLPGATNGLTATVVNLSQCGVGLLLERPLGEGIDFTFLVPKQAEPKPRELSARVMKVMPQSDGRWFAGCHLATPFTALELETIGRP